MSVYSNLSISRKLTPNMFLALLIALSFIVVIFKSSVNVWYRDDTSENLNKNPWDVSDVTPRLNMTKGIVYVLFLNASGQTRPDRTSPKDYSTLVGNSVKSLQRYEKVPLALITDIESEDLASDFSTYFDHIITIREKVTKPWGMKTLALRYSPFNYTMYVDGDTEFCSKVSELFNFLDRFDVAVVGEPYNKNEIKAALTEPKDKEMDYKFLHPIRTAGYTYQISGFLMYNDQPKAKEMMWKWHAMDEHRSLKDQELLQFAIYRTAGLSFIRFPEEVYYRNHPNSMPVFFARKVLMYHRSAGTNVSCEDLNKSIKPRIFENRPVPRFVVDWSLVNDTELIMNNYP